MLNRRALLQYAPAAAFGAIALGSVAAGGGAAQTAFGGLLGDPAVDPVEDTGFPKGINNLERTHLEKFDTLDFDVFTHADWDRLGESHAEDIRVHWPDGHYTDGIEQHIADLSALFVWAPDTRIEEHPIRIAMNGLTAVTGVMRGTFSQPMPIGDGQFIPANNKEYAINMATVGIWNDKGVMSEEFLFWDNLTFYKQIGLA